MKSKINPKSFPNYSNKRVVDQYMTELDTHGMSRREFLKLASAGAVASAAAINLGIPVSRWLIQPVRWPISL
jgi:hypothetical protein